MVCEIFLTEWVNRNMRIAVHRAFMEYRLDVASRTILWALMEQMRMLVIPILHRLHRHLAKGLPGATAAHAHVVLNGVSSVRAPTGGVYRMSSGKVEKPLAGYLALVGDLSGTG